MTTPAPLTIETDLTRNAARVRYHGAVTAGHLEVRWGDFEAFIAQLRPEFTVLVDFSGLDTMELECAAWLGRMMDLCRARGVGQVIRVVPDPSKDIGLNILSLIHYRGAVSVVTCATAAEAEALFG